MTPIFQAVFAEQWDALPPVLKTHYANRPFCRDRVTVKGHLNIRMAAWLKPFSALIKWSGMLTPYDGKNIPVTVHFESEPDTDVFVFHRTFNFPDRKPIIFRSRMMPVGAREVIEYMRFGIGWRADYDLAPDAHGDSMIIMRHLGYVWRIFDKDIDLPGFLSLFIGRGYAFEQAVSETKYAMGIELRSPLFGRLYAYSGTFEIVEVIHADA